MKFNVGYFFGWELFYTKSLKAIKISLLKELLLIAVIYYFIVAIKLNQLVQFEKKKRLLITDY